MIFQVGLQGLSSQSVSTSVQAQDHRTDKEGEVYIRWFLDNIDPDKPLGHLTEGFMRAGITNHVRLRLVAEDIEEAMDSMSFLQGLATGDQLVGAMIFATLDNLIKFA